jgi:hypothetical protein
MEIKGFKRILVGEPMPDKNDPKNKQRYEREVNAGKSFAKFTKIDKLAGHVQAFAIKNQKAFLALTFGTIILCFVLNVCRMAVYYSHRQTPRTATEMQDSLLKARHHHIIIGEQQK